MKNVSDVLANWPDDSKQVAHSIIDTYSEPDELTSSLLIWHQSGPWFKTIVYKQPIQHFFPMPHTDIVEQFVYYDIPPEKYTELGKFDGSVMVRRTEGLLSAKCHDEEANFLAVNLAVDIVLDKISAQEARQHYLQAMKDYRMGKSVPYMQALQFQPQPEGGDPGKELISKEDLDSYKNA